MELNERESVSMESVEDHAGGGGNQFEATLLWENIVNHLESSMKCGRHTQALRSFANCFYGSAAVDCLLPYLCTLLSKVVKREQVQILCGKLILTGVMEDVRSKDKEPFRESRLYRLTRNHFWSISSINSSNQDPLEGEPELSRARSAEDISTEKEDGSHFREDLKGYASDSTISCSARRRHSVHVPKKKRRSSSKKKHASGTSDLVLKKEAGFFQSIGTKLLLSSSWNKVNVSRLIFKGSDNTISSGPGESNESLAPPETKQRRKMASSRRNLKCPFPTSPKEEGEGVPFPISFRSGSWDKKRGSSNNGFATQRRWSTEKVRDETRHLPMHRTRALDRCKEDRIPVINVSVAEAWYDCPAEDNYYSHAAMRSPKKENPERARFDYPFLPDRHLLDHHHTRADRDYREVCSKETWNASQRGSYDARGDRERDHREGCTNGMTWRAARRGSCDASGFRSRRKSIDVGTPHGARYHSPGKSGAHAKRRKQSKEELLARHSEQKDNSTHTSGKHKPSAGSLKKKHNSRQDKPGKRKHVHRSHSFSSVEEFMTGPPPNHCYQVPQPNPRHTHLPLVQDSGTKWIVYGYL